MNHQPPLAAPVGAQTCTRNARHAWAFLGNELRGSGAQTILSKDASYDTEQVVHFFFFLTHRDINNKIYCQKQ